jgi:Ca2+-binding RTX toxin-like protein
VELAGEGVDLVNSSVTYTLSAEVENLTLASTGGAICGTGKRPGQRDRATPPNNTLDGGAGNDALNGGGVVPIRW